MKHNIRTRRNGAPKAVSPQAETLLAEASYCERAQPSPISRYDMMALIEELDLCNHEYLAMGMLLQDAMLARANEGGHYSDQVQIGITEITFGINKRLKIAIEAVTKALEGRAK